VHAFVLVLAYSRIEQLPILVRSDRHGLPACSHPQRDQREFGPPPAGGAGPPPGGDAVNVADTERTNIKDTLSRSPRALHSIRPVGGAPRSRAGPACSSAELSPQDPIQPLVSTQLKPRRATREWGGFVFAYCPAGPLRPVGRAHCPSMGPAQVIRTKGEASGAGIGLQCLPAAGQR
jgi:hypothetical protein